MDERSLFDKDKKSSKLIPFFIKLLIYFFKPRQLRHKINLLSVELFFYYLYFNCFDYYYYFVNFFGQY